MTFRAPRRWWRPRRSVLPVLLVAVLLASSCSTLNGGADTATEEEVTTTPPLNPRNCDEERKELTFRRSSYNQMVNSGDPYLTDPSNRELQRRLENFEQAEADLQECRDGDQPDQPVFDYAYEISGDDLNAEAVDQLVRWSARQCVGTTLTGLEEQIQRSRQLVALAHSGNIDDDPELIDEILNDDWARTVFEDPESLSDLLDLSDLWSELAEWSCTGELPTGS